MHPVKTLIRQIAGCICLLLFVVGTLIPVLPQLPFLALGALLLAPYVRPLKRVTAWFHKKYPKARPHMRPFRIFKKRAPAKTSSGQDSPGGVSSSP